MRHPSKHAEVVADITHWVVPPLYGDRRATLSLNIIVLGGGIGSHAAAHTRAGHRVTLKESLRELCQVGAGISVSHNATRFLLRCGLGPAVHVHVAEPTATVVRRYDTGERVGYARWIPHSERDPRRDVLLNPSRRPPHDAPPFCLYGPW